MNWIFSFFFLMMTLSATPISREAAVKNYFVVWNVGQGLWTTWVRPTECWHFDMGGEFFAWAKIRALCGNKINRVSLSHWDWDHIGALKKAPRYLPGLCIETLPLGKTTATKKSLLPTKKCPPSERVWQWQPQAKKSSSSNELSQIFSTVGFLLPGDSTHKEELQWAKALPTNNLHTLILGHHGSRTSTSDYLLNRLPHLKMAVCSARWRRYRHPHAEVLAVLQKHKIPILRTEDWGSLRFEL